MVQSPRQFKIISQDISGNIVLEVTFKFRSMLKDESNTPCGSFLHEKKQQKQPQPGRKALCLKFLSVFPRIF